MVAPNRSVPYRIVVWQSVATAAVTAALLIWELPGNEDEPLSGFIQTASALAAGMCKQNHKTITVIWPWLRRWNWLGLQYPKKKAIFTPSVSINTAPFRWIFGLFCCALWDSMVPLFAGNTVIHSHSPHKAKQTS